MLESLRDIPIVGDVRGAGYFHAIELVKDQDTDEQWSDEESETLLRGFLSGELYRRGLICRADDRGDPVIQLSPPLIAGPKQFEEIEADPAAGPHRGRRPDARYAPEPTSGPAPREPGPMLTVRELLSGLDVRLLCGEAATRPARALGAHLRAEGPDAVALRRRAAADHRHAARHPAAAARVRQPPGRPSARRPGLRHRLRPPGGSAGAAAGRRRARLSRCSRCPTRCRSSPSPRPPSPSWSTSSTPSCAARWPRTSGWSAWCSPSAGSRRWPARCRPWSGLPCSCSTPGASRWCNARFAARSSPRRSERCATSCPSATAPRRARAFLPALGEQAERALALPVAADGGAGGADAGRARARGMAGGDQGLAAR